jgi:threonine dehydrogenase-like Zn-dependent dehydrogenase
MRLVASERLDPSLFATHRFPLDDAMAAYEAFGDAARTGALKVVLYGPESASAHKEQTATALAS